MSLTVSVAGTTIADAIPPSSVQATQMANDGEAGFGGFSIDDPGSDILTVGHKAVVIEESECSQPRLFTGWTTQRDMGRSDERGMIVADDRLHDVTTVDMNAAFRFRILRGADTKRPEETMDERLAWLLTKPALTAFIDDTGYVSTGYDSVMDEADYRGLYPAAVLDDILARWLVDLTYFAFWDPVAEEVGLYFGPGSAATTESDLSISNVLSDVNGTTVFAPDSEATLARKPDQVYSQVILRYREGERRVYRERESTATASVDRGTTVDRPRTKKRSTAQTQAERFLSRHSTEVDTISCTIIVPPESAGLAVAGQRIDVKFSHLPGYTDWTSMRIVTSTVTPVNDVANRYSIAMELETPAIGSEPDPGEPECSFVAPTDDEDNSSEDVWGSTYVGSAGTSYNVGTCPAPTVAVAGQYYNGSAIYDIGTANDGNHWGLEPGVTGWEQTVIASWTWDFAGSPPAICYVAVKCYYAYGYWSLRGSDDGTDWTTIYGPVDANSLPQLVGAAISSPYPQYRYWQIYWTFNTGAGFQYFPGVIFEYFMLWEGTSPDADTEEDLAETPTSPVETTVYPTVDDDIEAGYSIGQVWVNTDTDEAFVLVDNTAGAAVWAAITNLTGDYVSIRDGGMEEVNTVADAGATETLNLGAGNVHDVTLTEDCTLTFAGATNGVACSFTLVLRQDGTGGWTTTWPGSVVWAGGAAPTLDETASTVAVLTFFTLDGGTVWYGFPSGGGGGGGTPATTVESETTFGIAAAVGTDTEYARQDHTHGTPANPVTGAAVSTLGFIGPILVSDTPSTPLVFADLIQNEAQDDLVYADL